MKILHLYHGVHKNRGVETFLYDLTNGLKDKYEQFLAVPKGKYQDIGLAFNKVFELNCFSDLKEIVKENNIDVLHVHYTGPETFHKHDLIKQGDIIYRNNMLPEDIEETPENNPYGFVNVFSLWDVFLYDEKGNKIKNPDRPKIIITTHTEDPLPLYISKPCIDEIIHVSYKNEAKNIQKNTKVIYPGIDLIKFFYTTAYAKQVERLKICFVGSVEKFDAGFMAEIHKDIYKKYDFYFFGEQKHFKSTENIFFEGKVDNIHERLQQMDIFLYPSTRDSFSIACLEAMASGLAIIATETVREVLDNTALIIELNQLEKALSDLEYVKLRHYLGSKARNRAKELYSLENFLISYDSLYQKLKKLA